MAEIDDLNELLDEKLKNRKSGGRKNKKWLLLLLLLFLFLLGAVLGGFFLYQKMRPQSRFEMDRNALEGFLPGKTEEEIRAELNRIIEEGHVNVSMNPTPVIKDGKMDVWIENVQANKYYLQADVYLYPEKGNTDKTELIYSSGILKQKHYIDYAEADTSAAPGEYDGIAIFTALDPDTLEEMGKVSLTLVITVEE